MAVDPRVVELMGRHNLEQQQLSAEFFESRPDLDPYDDGPNPWTYEDKMAMKAFFADARARWLREGAELQAKIDAEAARATA